jgi:hypothetical protein
MQEAQKTQNPKKDTSISEADNSRESADNERSGRSKLPHVDRNPLKKLTMTPFFANRALANVTMEPQTKKQEHKGTKEKRNGFKGLHSGKGTRATESRSQGGKNRGKK